MNENVYHTLNRFNAEEDWKKARRKVIYKDIVCLIKGCSVDLLSFQDVQKDLHLHQNQYLGLQTVPLENIRGSVGRFNDFDAAFMPRNEALKTRWQRVEVAMIEGKTPPVDLYKVNDDYYVVDGNHRVSVARQLGMEEIEAYVTNFVSPVDLSEADAQSVFLASERGAFLKKIGRSNQSLARSLEFTCAGCYEDLNGQIEEYRIGHQKLGKQDYTYSQAFADWYEEIYEPALEAIRENDLIGRFPDRTEADLYIWSAQNSDEITDIVMEQERID